MKKIYLIILIVFISALSSHAQSITGFTISPANPTTADSITIYVECQFNYANCPGDASQQGIDTTTHTVHGEGLHCVGLLTTLCSDIDTVIFAPLPAGQWTFVYLLWTGQGAGCPPAILPLVIDSTNFTVSTTTGLMQQENDFRFLIFPNPSTGSFTIKQNTTPNSLLRFFSAEGWLVKEMIVPGKEITIESTLPAGVYTAVLQSENIRQVSKLVIMK